MDIVEYLKSDIEAMRARLLEIEAERDRLVGLAEQQRGALAYATALLAGIEEAKKRPAQNGAALEGVVEDFAG